MNPPFLTRVKQSVRAIGKGADIFLGSLWKGALYPFGLADLPTGREFISTICGKAAANGWRWGKIASAIIDRVAVFLGDDPDHCLRMYLKYDAIDN